MDNLTGYLNSGYAYSFSEFGAPRYLPSCGGWILERTIPGSDYRDGMNCYPFFVCHDWRKLHSDISDLKQDLVSLVIVTDPFSDIDKAYLTKNFNYFIPFKRHFIVDLKNKKIDFVHKYHFKHARKSLKKMEVEICQEPICYLKEWIILYNNLIERHNIKGLRAFSPESFRKQFSVPGMILFVGRYHDEIIGALLVAIINNKAYAHLMAYSSVGYNISASHGIMWVLLNYLINNDISYLDLGGVAGLKDIKDNGLLFFKQGWSNFIRPVYICFSILKQKEYFELCKSQENENCEYFPLYRKGEY